MFLHSVNVAVDRSSSEAAESAESAILRMGAC